MIHRVVLDNNGLDDIGLSILLEGLRSQDLIDSVVIKGNEVGEKSLGSLFTLLKRKRPHHIDELRLIDCKIGSIQTEKLMKRLV